MSPWNHLSFFIINIIKNSNLSFHYKIRIYHFINDCVHTRALLHTLRYREMHAFWQISPSNRLIVNVQANERKIRWSWCNDIQYQNRVYSSRVTRIMSLIHSWNVSWKSITSSLKLTLSKIRIYRFINGRVHTRALLHGLWAFRKSCSFRSTWIFDCVCALTLLLFKYC